MKIFSIFSVDFVFTTIYIMKKDKSWKGGDFQLTGKNKNKQDSPHPKGAPPPAGSGF